jgi:regulatory protein
VIRELVETGYLDDARYARLYAEDKRRLEQWGSARIRRELVRRGIESELIDAAIASDGAAVSSAESELERAITLLQQRFPDPPRERRARERALGLLVRRGYPPELAIDAITAYSREGS